MLNGKPEQMIAMKIRCNRLFPVFFKQYLIHSLMLIIHFDV